MRIRSDGRMMELAFVEQHRSMVFHIFSVRFLLHIVSVFIVVSVHLYLLHHLDGNILRGHRLVKSSRLACCFDGTHGLLGKNDIVSHSRT